MPVSPPSAASDNHGKSRPSTCASSNSRETWMTARGSNRMGKGILVFTGPDGRKNQDVKIPEDKRYIGIGEVSAEKSSELIYLYRPATGAPFHRAKADIPGSIGWGLPRKGDPRTWPVHMNICSEEEFKTTRKNSEGIWNNR
ncbi:uncharacterized protein C4orf45-like [Asterias rubens]|uniref:uncharacterized protein C4orf45-like n=1 Tax=Asterias rubens TaxID=7604 RepID=UPI0014558D8F|nr:uncharacterized protein C4orf45-like [Asterias rubens]